MFSGIIIKLDPGKGQIYVSAKDVNMTSLTKPPPTLPKMSEAQIANNSCDYISTFGCKGIHIFAINHYDFVALHLMWKIF